MSSSNLYKGSKILSSNSLWVRLSHRNLYQHPQLHPQAESLHWRTTDTLQAAGPVCCNHGFMYKGDLRFCDLGNPEQCPALLLDLTHAMSMLCHSHHLCFSLTFCTTHTSGHVGSKTSKIRSRSRSSSRLQLPSEKCFSSDIVSASSKLPETNTSLFYCINILLGHVCVDELCLCRQMMKDGRGSQSASALQTHCFLVPLLTKLCPHIIAGEPALSQKENRKHTVLLWGSSSTLNRVIYYHFISKTCCWGERKVMFVFEVLKTLFSFSFFFSSFMLNPKGSKPEVPSCLKELGIGHLWPDSPLYLSQIYLQWADRATSE